MQRPAMRAEGGFMSETNLFTIRAEEKALRTILTKALRASVLITRQEERKIAQEFFRLATTRKGVCLRRECVAGELVTGRD